ncbi:MAG: aminoacyl-tRNA hydrolase, partial [Candidatus Pacearchaeota archaeon]|nr:aminoacyl-tRNA hydrolase [Candidatus Pacearchaeota archaeon]
EKNRLRAALYNRINDSDEIVIHVQDERSQIKNRDIALQRIIRLITSSLKTKKKRVITQPSKKAKERRLKQKKNRSELKKQRERKLDMDE